MLANESSLHRLSRSDYAFPHVASGSKDADKVLTSSASLPLLNLDAH
jgi:hypothetical protein